MMVILGRYEIIGLLGSGGIGQVYAARDRSLGRPVAIKALRPEYIRDEAFLQRFHSEAASLARLSHQNVATLYDFQADEQQLYMIMELVRGHTLEAVLARLKRLDVAQALAITSQAIVGLSYAHRMGVIHRDIKPSNLMLTDTGTLKIMDFGIARVRGSQRLTRAGSIIGTLAYVAPEQIKGGEGDERSDLYSVACLLYEMLTGEPPFTAKTEYDLIRAQVDTAPQSLASKLEGAPGALAVAVDRALAKDPQQRFGSMLDFGRALGSEEIQNQSEEIIRNLFMEIGPVANPIEATGPTSLPLPVNSSGSKQTPKPMLPGLTRFPARRFNAWWKRRLSAPAMPIVVLGSVVVSLALGALYFLIASGPDHGELTASPAVVAPAQEVSVATREPPRSTLILPAPNSQSAATTVEKPTASPPAAMAPTSGVQDAIAPSTEHRGPLHNETPAYEGRVADWPGPNLIAVPLTSNFGLKFLKLYGILDTSSGQAQAIQDHTKMMSFLASAGNMVTCYARGESTFQCYANSQDIALWAVKAGLARATVEAPSEYRATQK